MLLLTLILLGKCFLFYSSNPQSYVMAKGVKAPFDIPVEILEPTSSTLLYQLPLSHPNGVTITQGPLNLVPGSSHGYLNCLYAMDFASSTPEEGETAPGRILAARSGTVVALHGDSPSHHSFYNFDSSGDGFGNWIAIEHEENEISFYSHLSEISVKVGDRVECGQEIGIEGSTGQAGFRHLHFSIHRLIGKKPQIIYPYYPSQYECIPYSLQYYDSNNHQIETDIRVFSKTQLSRLKIF